MYKVIGMCVSSMTTLVEIYTRAEIVIGVKKYIYLEHHLGWVLGVGERGSPFPTSPLPPLVVPYLKEILPQCLYHRFEKRTLISCLYAPGHKNPV